MVSETTSYPHLISDQGEPCLRRLPRIRVAMIAADHLGHGWSAEQIAEQYPHLRLAEIHSALAYYYDHPAKIQAILNDELLRCGQETPGSLRAKLISALQANK